MLSERFKVVREFSTSKSRSYKALFPFVFRDILVDRILPIIVCKSNNVCKDNTYIDYYLTFVITFKRSIGFISIS